MTGGSGTPRDSGTTPKRSRRSSSMDLWLDDPLDPELSRSGCEPGVQQPVPDGAENESGEDKSEEAAPHPKMRNPYISSKLWNFLASKKKVFFRGLLGLLFVAALLGGALAIRHYLLSSPAFNVRTIEVSSMRHDLSLEIKKATSRFVGRNIFTVRMDEVAESVKQIPWVADARAWRSLPDTIHVDVVEHEVAAALFRPDHGFFLVSREGRIFKKASPAELRGLAVITGLTLKDLEHSDLPLRESLRFIEIYRSNPARPALSEIRHMGTEIAFTLRSIPVEVRIANGGDLDRRLDTFDRIYRAIRDDLQKKTIIYIDIADKPGTAVVSHPKNGIADSNKEEGKSQ